MPKGGPRGEERGAGEEEEGRAGEAGKGVNGTAAASSLRRVQHRRFALFFLFSRTRCAALWEGYATEEAPQHLRSWGLLIRHFCQLYT